jgi:penicillin-insensitive murein endopeptidase
VVKKLAATLFSVAVLSAVAAAPVWAQDTAAQEAAKRKSVLEQLPADAAKRLFGLATTPAPGAVRVIGGYTKGCVAGAQQLPADGDNWQVMRPSRNRSWGAPVLIEFIQRLAASLPGAAGWPGLMVGDMAQPRGGPMLTGHASHQLGIEADIWLTPMPDRRLTPTERDELSATNVVAANGLDIDPGAWAPAHRKLLETVARSSGVARVFVNPAIKKALCRETGSDRGWLRMIRPWWGHNYHFHIRLACPAGQGECDNQEPPGPGDGCDEVGRWFTEEMLHPKPGPPARPLRISEMPAACTALVQPR